LTAPRRPGLFDTGRIGQWPALHIDPRELDELILIHGNSGELRRAVLCPCVRVETRMANAACTACKGIGLLYPPELACPMIFLDRSRQIRTQRQGAGLLDDGTIQVTVPAGTIPAENDMLLPDGDVAVVQEVFHRDLQQVSNQTLADRLLLPDQQSRRLRPRRAALLYPSVTELEALAWRREDGEVFLGRPGIDYRLSDGAVEWLKGESPPVGGGFSVRYRAPAAYIIHGSAPLFRHEADRAVPWSVTAQRLDKIQRVSDLR
jgi:hypothetical protein